MDRFDDIWKNRFNGSDKPIAGWGVPDDSVWEGIEPHVEDKSNQKLLWWFSFGILMLGLLLFSILVISKKEQTAELTNDGTKIEATINDAQPLVFIPKDTVINGQETQKNRVVQPKLKRSNKITPLITVEKPQTFTQTNNDFSVQTYNSPNNLNGNSIQSSNLIDVVEKEELADLKFLPVLKSNLEVHTTPSYTYWSMKNIIKPINRSKIFSVGVTAGTVYWKHRISNQYTSDLSPFDFKPTDEFGWQAAILGAAQLGQYFELKSGVRLEKIKVGSGHNSDLKYDPTTEVIPNTNNYERTLATPYGLTAAGFVLNRNSDIGTNEVALKVDFHSNHNITNINLPMELGFYPFGKKKTITPFVKAGVGYNYVSKISNEIDNIDTHHSAIVFDKSSQTFANPDIQNSFFDLRAGAGINYQLTNRLQLNLLYDFSRGINPVFRQDNYRTTIDRQYISLEIKSYF